MVSKKIKQPPIHGLIVQHQRKNERSMQVSRFTYRRMVGFNPQQELGKLAELRHQRKPKKETNETRKKKTPENA